MATLTQAATYSRSIIKWGFVFVVGLMVGRMVIGSLYAWYRANNPIIPPPTLGFGQLPPVEFPTKEQPAVSYRLETVDGGFPKFPTQAEVIFMPATRPNLLAMERSITEAGDLGYNGSPEKLNDLTYRWKNNTPLMSTLTMQIYDGRFVLDADWVSNPNFLTERSLPQQSQAVKDAKDLIRKTGVTADDLTKDNVKFKYLKGTVTGYQPVASLSDADFIQIDLFRTPYKDKYPFVTADPERGIVQIIISGNNRLAKYSHVEYNYFPIDYTKVETYPMKTAEQAWQELQAGKGFIAQLDKGVTEAVVRRVEVGFFDSYTAQHYAQPVYVFTGDGNFVAYVPALADLSQLQP